MASRAPQFSTAEYAHIPGTERCRICNSLIGPGYYRVNGQMACAQCASEAQSGQPRDSHAAFSRALLLGSGAAVAGMAVYAAFTIITGWSIGYLALGVGYVIAKAMKKASHGLGGRRYQIAAVLLTYAAISMAAVPVAVSYAMKQAKQTAAAQGTASGTAPDGSYVDQRHSAKTRLNWTAIAGPLVLFGLASPFTGLSDPLHGLIGLFILFIGLRIAWQMTGVQTLALEGPYANTGTA